MLIVLAPDHARSDSKDLVDTFLKSPQITKVVVFNAQDSRETPSSFLQEALLFSTFIAASPAWQSNEVIDFLPRLSLIHTKMDTETIFYSGICIAFVLR